MSSFVRGTGIVRGVAKHKRAALARARASAIALLLVAAACHGAPRAAPPANDARDEARIRGLLDRQTEAWNRGDLHEFVAGYAAEPELMTYVGGDGALVRGRDALEARYREHYPAGHGGTLSFSDLVIRRLGPNHYLVIGKWSLARPPDDPHGPFTLVFERRPEGLLIVHDHSSSAAR